MEVPFIVGKPVTGEYFINREDELSRMISLLSAVKSGSSSNVALIGLRRTGKTSLFENVRLNLMSEEKVVPIVFNCFGISTKVRFSSSFMQEVARSYMEKKKDDRLYKERIFSLLRKGWESLSKRVSEVDVSIAEYAKFGIKLRQQEVDENELIEIALNYPETLGRSKDVYFVVMIDEFQDTFKWGDDFLKTFRKIVESQKRVAYAFSGSATTVMRGLLYRKRSPFYRQLVEVKVGKLPPKPAKEFVVSRFKKVGMNISEEALDMLLEYSDGYPDYIQRLGLRLHMIGISQERSSLGKEDIKNAYEEMIQQLDGEFSNYFTGFSDFEREVLIALAHGRTNPSSIAREIRKPITSIPQIVARLINHGIAEKHTKGHYRISDFVFSDWVRRRYPIAFTGYEELPSGFVVTK